MLLNTLENPTIMTNNCEGGWGMVGSGMDNGFTSTSNPNTKLERGEGFEG